VTDSSQVSIGFSLESSLFILQMALAVGTKMVPLRAELALLRPFLYIHLFSLTKSDSINISFYVCMHWFSWTWFVSYICGIVFLFHFYTVPRLCFLYHNF
jgi:hypothetical protein